MADYKEYKQKIINGKKRILYKKVGTSKLYLKKNNKMIAYKNYKKQVKPKKIQKQKSTNKKIRKIRGKGPDDDLVAIMDTILMDNLTQRMSSTSMNNPRFSRSLQMPNYDLYKSLKDWIKTYPYYNSQKNLVDLLYSKNRGDLVNKFQYFINTLPE
jgi:hypothetical protein